MQLKIALGLCFLLQGLIPSVNQDLSSPVTTASEKLANLFENYFEEHLKLNPIAATAIGDHRYDDQFPNDISEEHRARRRDFYARYLQALSAIDRRTLTEQDRLNYDLLKYESETALAGLACNDHWTPINQMGDTTTFFAQLASGKSAHPFKTVKNYEDFLGRMRGFQRWLETALTNMQKGIAAGVVQPRIVIERKLPQINALLVDDIKQSLFYQPILNLPADFSTSDKARLTEQYTRAITDIIYPGYRRLHDYLKNEYLPKTRNSVGLSAIPNGTTEYVYRVKLMTTTNLPPDKIHELGLSEVRRLRGEMEKVKAQVGFKGDLQAFFEYVRADPKFYPFQSAEEVLAAYRAIEGKLRPALPNYFGLIPTAKFEIRQTEKFREASANEQYFPASPDGSRPGIFYVPIPDPTKYQSIRMESVFLHEAIPGHHFQTSIQQEQKKLPKFRQLSGNTAYIEGWGLYTEALGQELGLYRDPYQYFGMLSGEIHRAIRLVVDTGIHWKGWSREQAIRYSLENEPLAEDKITAEVERYIARVGQALAYKIGQLKILELRRKSERELGGKFQIKEFHNEVLKDGSLPLEVLETKINEWITNQRRPD